MESYGTSRLRRVSEGESLTQAQRASQILGHSKTDWTSCVAAAMAFTNVSWLSEAPPGGRESRCEPVHSDAELTHQFAPSPDDAAPWIRDQIPPLKGATTRGRNLYQP